MTGSKFSVFNFLFIGVIFLSMGSPRLFGQLLDQNFDDEDLSAWSGDVSDFTVNVISELQLNAAEGGQTTLWTPVNFTDSLTWEMFIALDFSPSGGNKLAVYLAVDNMDLTLASGYALLIGEDGSDDAIRLVKLTDGFEEEIASGSMGKVATAFDLKLKLVKNGDDIFTLTVGERNAVVMEEEIFVSSPDSFFPSSGYFGLDCTYTSTRKDKFYFDDIRISELVPDRDPPMIVDIAVVDSMKLNVEFSEAVEETTFLFEQNASLPSSVDRYIVLSPNEICILLTEPMPSGEMFDVSFENIEDLNGNKMPLTTFPLVLTETPRPGDLIINEILYEQLTGLSADFVEIMNVSDKFLSLENVFFRRANSTSKDVQVLERYILAPEELIAFTQDTQEIIELYQPPSETNLEQLDLMNYVSVEGNVTILTMEDNIETILDAFDYTNDYHSQLLSTSAVKGVSLERLDPRGITNDPDNWYSAASVVNYATPGYQNSQRSQELSSTDNVFLEEKVFSPDGDGYKDLMRLNYQVDKNGFIASVNIYDDSGRLLMPLSQNKILGTGGTILWDGILEDGRPAPIGMYIIEYHLFHEEGEVISGRKACVLARRLD